jgi:hypothetical protein
MTQKSIFTIGLILLAQILFAQVKIPIIKAVSKTVDIRDGDTFKKASWTITPDVHPDVYATSVSKKPKRITFYTDQDSISFSVKSNSYFLFNILLNGKDTALTGILSYDTLGTLKKAGKYNFSEKRALPKFTYQSETNPNLVELRKAFNLDSVAGQGNEVSKILNLLHWIHNLVPHDGNHENPVIKNAMSMIAICKRDNRGLNCRGLATVLNECYLAMGIKSRFVTCLPKDSLGIDNDCHVINMVYSTEQKKWLWIDPTFDAYVMNEKGELLSIEEVRERIILNKPLIINPDANWNHKASEEKEYYLYSYMAKNLYKLQCHLNSEYDSETRGLGKTETYMTLLPLEYFKQMPIKSEHEYRENKTTFIYFNTNNPTVFWASPD